MLARDEILEVLKREMPYLGREFKVKSIGLFGSFLRGKQEEKSDIDILVEFYEPIGLKFLELKEYLENFLNTEVDLVVKKALKPRLKDRILKEAVML